MPVVTLKRALRDAILAGVLVAGLVPAAAQTRQEPPRGLPWGNLIVAPYLQAGYQSDDNIFRVDAADAQSDQITTVQAGILAHLPIRNSLLTFDYEAEYRSYAKNRFSRNLDQQGGITADLNFSTFDRLVLSEHYNRGISEIQEVDPGGERTFTGQPFNYNEAGVEVSREIPGRPGYLARVTRIDLNFVRAPGEEQVFFDYRGYESAFEYRHPLPGSRYFLVHYDRRRFDHFRDVDPEPPYVEYPTGVPYRQESWDALSVGIQGVLGRRQPFYARIGTGRFRYHRADGRPSADFNGVIFEGRLRLTLGAKTGVTLGLVRRPLPSNFETYYIINELRVEADRRWLRSSRAGLNVLYSRNSYGDEDSRVAGRSDQRVRLEAFVDWFFHAKIGIRFSAAHLRRYSNDNVAAYRATVLSSGLRFGWF